MVVPDPRAGQRRGVVLLIVLTLLTLFALVAVSFVLVAESAAQSAALFRRAQVVEHPDADAEFLLNYFLGQLLYDLPDGEKGAASALRGHGLLRLVYGLNDQAGSGTPYSGTGRLHGPSPFPGVDDFYLVNYTLHRADGFLRDPERPGWRADPNRARMPYTGGFNAPYTYPDLNNMFLAAVRADGTVMLPSYHRPWTGFGPLDPANPNWYDRTNPALKYLTLRPRPADMGRGFPAPEDSGGDVKNLLGTSGGNDSIWLDLGYPVQAAPDGRRYKPLFAPLVVDLDGRVNLNAHGNVRGKGATGKPAHASNQGWGPWEVNLSYVLSGEYNGEKEWPRLFEGRRLPRQQGRYGDDGLPGSNRDQMPPLPPFHVYAQADLDACEGTQLTPVPARLSRTGFPQFPTGYEGGGAELVRHPALYSPVKPPGDDRAFPAAALEGLLRHGDTGGASLSGELTRYCPVSFADARRRRLVTTHSFDLDRPGAAPWVYDPAAFPYAVPPGQEVPLGPPVPFPPLSLRKQSVPEGSDFTAPGLEPNAPGVDWRSTRAALGRVDLGRPLTPYAVNRAQAHQDRQQLAGEVYDRLLASTGVTRSASTPNRPTAQELQVRRWLAQLAVNLVDYLDDDDVSTPFGFYTAQDAQNLPFDVGEAEPASGPDGQPLPRYWVFGTELPRLVLNEALVEYAEEVVPRDAPVPTTVRAWVELHHPLPTVPAGRASHPLDSQPTALLAGPGSDGRPFAPYQVVLARGVAERPFHDNVLGEPEAIRAATRAESFAGATPVSPQGFILVGAPGGDARETLDPQPKGPVPPEVQRIRTRELQYRRDFPPGRTEEKAEGLTILLRRLADPARPHDPNPGLTDDATGESVPNPNYNPFVTVDYLDAVPLRDPARSGVYASAGKRQPFAAHRSQVVGQQAGDPDQKTQHTFGLRNNPEPASGYDWLVHLDRRLVSVPEVLHVSACAPHLVTQRFVTGDAPGEKFRHTAPWFDQRRRLYRAFEFLTTRGLGPDGHAGGRVPGKVNLNTIWDLETFLALCDPQPANGPNLTEAAARQAYAALVAQRTPGGVPGPRDRPFLGQAAGYSAAQSSDNPDVQQPWRGRGINDTLLRAAAPDADGLPDGGAELPRLFEVPGEEHPYRRAELLTKIYNQVTARSHVFAVWVTVGFFEVTDDTTRPVRLGAEVGRAENRHVRRRFFAVVDRSARDDNPGPQPRFDARRDGLVLYYSVIE